MISSAPASCCNDGLPFADVVTESLIRDALVERGVRYRDRLFNPFTTVWGFLSQVLSDDHSCREAVSRMIAHRAAGGLETCSPNTASYCDARGRHRISRFFVRRISARPVAGADVVIEHVSVRNNHSCGVW